MKNSARRPIASTRLDRKPPRLPSAFVGWRASCTPVVMLKKGRSRLRTG